MSAYFQTSLMQPLEFGQSLEIRAQAEHDATWFHISLTAPKTATILEPDVGLHMLVSLNVDVIAFKHCVQENWTHLKSIEFDTSQFVYGFKVNIIVDEQNYHIGINDEPCIFVKRVLPLERLNTLKINGHLKRVQQVDHRKHFPYPWPPIQLSEDYVHFSNEQPIPFSAGHVMIIRMKLSGNDMGRLLLQFRNVWHITREELHMSIRFDVRQIVMNSKLPIPNSEELAFGQEKCHHGGQFPFAVFSETFKLAVAFTETSFKIAKDGTLIDEYAYRSANALEEMMGLKMYGVGGLNVRVYSVDHVHLSDVQCLDFEQYSKLKYK